MSDFLSSLVARSFGATPVIRPRVSSLFEPVRGDATRLGETFGGKNDDDKIEVQEEEVTARKPESREPARRTAVLPGQGEHKASSATDHVVVSAVPEHSAQLVREPERNAITEKLIARHERRIPVGEVRHLDDANRAAPSIPMIQSPSPALDKPSVPYRLDLPAAVRPDGEDRHGQLIPAKITPEMRIPEIALSAKPAHRRSDEHRFLRKEAQPAEPTVQVTIGRIEVRATQQNARTSRPASTSPVMSLDEYLSKRGQRVGQ